MSAPARDVLVCAAALLDQGRTLDRLSRPLTAAALIAVLITPAMPQQPPGILLASAIAVAIAGLVETYFAIRVGFDAALFRHLATASEPPDFSVVDGALRRLGLLRGAHVVDRPADGRVGGAMRLLRLQALALAAQILCAIAGASIAWMR